MANKTTCGFIGEMNHMNRRHSPYPLVDTGGKEKERKTKQKTNTFLLGFKKSTRRNADVMSLIVHDTNHQAMIRMERKSYRARSPTSSLPHMHVVGQKKT